MMEELFNTIKLDNKKLDIREVKMLSPLQLAYIGDAVYELLVRTYLLKSSNLSVNELHKKAVKFVKAKAQADIILFLEKQLTEEEWGVVKRGRNAKTSSIPKNASLIDYKYATGLEALFGYLYLTEQKHRIIEIFEETIKKVEGDL